MIRETLIFTGAAVVTAATIVFASPPLRVPSGAPTVAKLQQELKLANERIDFLTELVTRKKALCIRSGVWTKGDRKVGI